MLRVFSFVKPLNCLIVKTDMKRNYIQPLTEAQMMQGLHMICNSPAADITGGNEPADPNNVEIF